MKYKLIALPMIAAMVVSTAVSAQDAPRRGPGHPPGVEKEAWDAMSTEQKKAFHQERKAKWQAMSDSEKVQMIEQHRSKRMEKMDAKWNAMSDAEKVKFAEEKMQKRKGKRKGGE